jgi:putative addiction module component (TIGR02574 family)
MSKRSDALLAEVMKLSEGEKAELAEEILEGVDGRRANVDSMSEEAFAKELSRRHEEFLRNLSVGIPLDEVKRRTRIS